MYQGGFGIAGKDKLADALLLLGLHQLRGQQPLAAAGSPGPAGEGPAHAAHGPAALPAPSGGPAPRRHGPPPRARREPIGVREARRAPPPRALTNPISERPLNDSGMRQVATYQGKGGACGGAAPAVSSERNPLGAMGGLSPGVADGGAIPSARSRRMTSEGANLLAWLRRRVGQTGR